MEPQPGGRVQTNMPDHDGISLRGHGHGISWRGGATHRRIQIFRRLSVPAPQVGCVGFLVTFFTATQNSALSHFESMPVKFGMRVAAGNMNLYLDK